MKFLNSLSERFVTPAGLFWLGAFQGVLGVELALAQDWGQGWGLAVLGVVVAAVGLRLANNREMERNLRMWRGSGFEAQARFAILTLALVALSLPLRDMHSLGGWLGVVFLLAAMGSIVRLAILMMRAHGTIR